MQITRHGSIPADFFHSREGRAGKNLSEETSPDFRWQLAAASAKIFPALVIHGGTIMNIMEEYADEERSFYDWHVKNGKGYEVEIDTELWKKERRSLHVVREL